MTSIHRFNSSGSAGPRKARAQRMKLRWPYHTRQDRCVHWTLKGYEAQGARLRCSFPRILRFCLIEWSIVEAEQIRDCWGRGRGLDWMDRVIRNFMHGLCQNPKNALRLSNMLLRNATASYMPLWEYMTLKESRQDLVD